MSNLDIPKLQTISEVVKKIKNRELKVTDLIIEHIERAKKVNDSTNSFITIFDGVSNSDQYDPIEKAKQIDNYLDNGTVSENSFLKKYIEKGSKLELLGVPFTAKDLYLVKNTRTTFGSRLMEDFIAPYTGTVIEKCFEQGAILIGKTNCDPWGFGGSGENSGFGPAKNPYDLERTPGGSSSGSAASLAAGVGYFSLGTDTGGSVRQPASMCGLYGLKPTYGRNSRYGIGVMGSSFDTPGFFARYSEDILLLEKIMEGRDINDPSSHTPAKSEKKEKLKIGIPKEFFAEGLDSEIREAIEKKIQEYKEAGHAIFEVSIPSVDYSLSVYYILVPAEISSNRARYDGVRFGKKVSDEYEENLILSRSKYFEDEVKRRIMIGTYVLQAGFADQYYYKAMKVRSKIKREFKKVFKQVDLLVAPTSPTTAFKLGEKTNDPIQMYLADIYTVAASVAGIPSLNIPIGMDKKGLPMGMQVMASWDEDYDLFF
ncbi:MAG: Asp-tRNA(Asn)/Glu-tRNA(Gln) amidotransferase subunit GatA [Candidatus Dojkabacteria bacterium]